MDFGRYAPGLHLETVKMQRSRWAVGSRPRSRPLSHPVVRVAGVISCVYCGGAHARPADVRKCWAEHEMPSLALETEHVAEPLAAARPAAAPSGWHGGRGPAALGRHAIVADASAPSELARLPPNRDRRCRARLSRGDRRRTAPRLGRRRVAGDRVAGGARSTAQIDQRPQHVLGPGHTFWRDELHQLIWRNAVDLRVPDAPRWSVLDDAAALGAQPVGDATAGDVVLPTGEVVWLDGGPIRHHDPVAGIAVLHAVQLEHGTRSGGW